MSFTLYSGTSHSNGRGFEGLKDDPALWVNQLHFSHPELAETDILNISVAGKSNESVFRDTAYELLHKDVKYAFVEWTSMPRYNLSIGTELYPTDLFFIPNSSMKRPCIEQLNYTREQLEDIRDKFTSLADLHYEICNLISYVNSLVKIAELTDTKIFFINGLCPWDKDYFTKLNSSNTENYTPFTKTLLKSNTRSNKDLIALYKKIHAEYTAAGTIQESYWLNLYESMDHLQQDTCDGWHPGIESHTLYTTHFNNILNSKLKAAQ